MTRYVHEYKCNNETRSRNHCYRGGTSITYSACVCVCVCLALVIHHAMHALYYAVICGLSHCTIFFHIIS
jgi:uncharacterized membrane protein